MKTPVKILLPVFLLMILTIQVPAQTSVRSDSTVVSGKKSATAAADNDKSSTARQNGNGQDGAASHSMNGAGSQSIKQVRGARPDMSRARSARPPKVVRQSGSGIPRGMGKPGGAPGHGKR